MVIAFAGRRTFGLSSWKSTELEQLAAGAWRQPGSWAPSTRLEKKQMRIGSGFQVAAVSSSSQNDALAQTIFRAVPPRGEIDESKAKRLEESELPDFIVEQLHEMLNENDFVHMYEVRNASGEAIGYAAHSYREHGWEFEYFDSKVQAYSLDWKLLDWESYSNHDHPSEWDF
jgi:hypothetical protein